MLRRRSLLQTSQAHAPAQAKLFSSDRDARIIAQCSSCCNEEDPKKSLIGRYVHRTRLNAAITAAQMPVALSVALADTAPAVV